MEIERLDQLKRHQPEEDFLNQVLSQSAQKIRTNLHGKLRQAEQENRETQQENKKLVKELDKRYGIIHGMSDQIQEAQVTK